MYLARESSQEWAARKVDDLPARWRKRLTARWEQDRQAGPDWMPDAEREANIRLRTIVDNLHTLRMPLDASDATICEAAGKLADRSSELARIYHTLPELRAAMARLAEGQGVKPPLNDPCKSAHIKDGPAVARMSDPLWWRRGLRAMHGRTVEAAAIDLGYVNRTRDAYVSNESVERRAQQNSRNRATLESTIAINEDGQEFTLAELAAAGPANKAIRRAELMTRISGFEKIALDMQHQGLFLTMTAPSHMHKWRTVAGGRVIENPLFDGTTPKQAQAYHAKTWGRIRAALARRGVKLYGFRIAEPNHDGTPHWHLLIFVSPHWPGWTERDGVRRVCAIIRRYCLQDAGQERGAKAHRVDFKPIDAGKGSAAGYIAKYVAKNIDGYALEKDLIGNDAVTTSHRVEAWASTWGIRQFQQVGGPPVGPWRELRRVKAIPAGAPACLVQAHAAVNRTVAIDGAVKAASWAEYVKAQGGVYIGRAAAIKVSKAQDPNEKGRYGDPAAPRPIGVETVSMETYSPAWGLTATRAVHWVVESSRHVWEIVKSGAAKARGFIEGVFNGAQRPWTRVNNCTQEKNGTTLYMQGEQHQTGNGVPDGLGQGPDPHQSHGRGLRGADSGGHDRDESGAAPALAGH